MSITSMMPLVVEVAETQADYNVCLQKLITGNNMVHGSHKVRTG